MYIPAHGLVRRFVLFTAPSVADPAWIIPVVELDERGIEIMSYTDVSELKALVDKMERDQTINAVRLTAEVETLKKTLEILGVSREEYDKKWGEFYGTKA